MNEWSCRDCGATGSLSDSVTHRCVVAAVAADPRRHGPIGAAMNVTLTAEERRNGAHVRAARPDTFGPLWFPEEAVERIVAARLAAVEALHRPGSSGNDGAYCVSCLAEPFPCPTVRALTAGLVGGPA